MKKLPVLVLLVFVGFLFIYLYKSSNISLIPFVSPTPIVPNEVEIRGQHVCLPHKNTRGVQTLECAIGIKSDEGNFYALELSGLPSDVTRSFGANKNIFVKGLLVPVELLSTDHWQKYDMKGIVQVKSLEVLP